MRLKDYEFSSDDWTIGKTTFNRVNVFFGESATGKTRVLNTIFNLGVSIVRNSIVKTGNWNTSFIIGEKEYKYNIATEFDGDDPLNRKIIVKKEKLSLNNKTLFERKNDTVWLGKKKQKSVINELSLISIYKNVRPIDKIYPCFATIKIHRFDQSWFKNEYSGKKEREVSKNIIEKLKKENDIIKRELIFLNDDGLHIKLYLMKQFLPKSYASLIAVFKGYFPFVTSIKMEELSRVSSSDTSVLPVFSFEEGAGNKYHLAGLSSGMLKVLVLLVSYFTIPEGGILLIDEYENSLGSNIIKLFLDFVYKDIDNKEIQFFISTHNSYIINHVEFEDVFLFKRENMDIQIINGKEIIKKYGPSNHDNFIKLINKV